METVKQLRPVWYMLAVGNFFWWLTTNDFVNVPENWLTVGLGTLLALFVLDTLVHRWQPERRYLVPLVVVVVATDVLFLVLANGYPLLLRWVAFMIAYLISDVVVSVAEHLLGVNVSQPVPTPRERRV